MFYLCCMNWVKVILALYITFLACLPCSDTFAQAESDTASASAQADADHNSLYQENHLAVYASIWQPPKV